MRFLLDEQLYTDTAYCLEHLRRLPGGASSGPRESLHVYWEGDFSRKQAFAIKSILATQDLDRVQVWLWLPERPDTEYLRPLLPFAVFEREVDEILRDQLVVA